MENHSNILLGLNGFKGVGKDTVAQILINNYGFERRAFADKLKESAAALFDISREDVDDFKQNGVDDLAMVHVTLSHEIEGWEKQFNWREFLQRFGTEMGRDTFGEDFWINHVLPRHPIELIQSRRIVITDARFKNELTRIHELGGYNVRINRQGYSSDGHESEIDPATHLIDYHINNDGSIEDLEQFVDVLITVIDERTTIGQ